MAAGRRRRNSSSVNKASQGTGSGGLQLQADPKEEAEPVSNSVEENSALNVGDVSGPSPVFSPLATENQNPPPVDDLEDDPFAYDSDLETLSSVSSHMSMSSSSSSALGRALGLTSAADPEEQEDDKQSVEASSLRDYPYDKESVATNNDETSENEPPMADGQSKSRGSSKRNTPSSSVPSDNEEDGDQEGSEKLESHRSSNIYSDQSNKRIRRQRGADKTEHAFLGQDLESNSQAPNSDTNSPETDDDEAQSGASATQDKHMPDHQIEESNAVAEEGSENQDGQSHSAEDANDRNDSQNEDADDNEARRSAAFAELTSIEIEFAQLRERLYTERLQQVQIEEDYLLAGRHAEYERHARDITSAYTEQMERLQYEQQEWLKQRLHLHQTMLKSTNYTFLVRRQELRTRMLNAQRRRMWRLRDMRVQEDRRFAEKTMATAHLGSHNPLPIDEDVALIAQQTNSNIQQLRWARRAATNAQRCLVHGRKQRLAVPGLDPAEMDADYMAMNLPVHPREQKSGFRHIYVPPFILEAEAARAAAGANKKRKPRQPRQPKKKRAVDKDGSDGMPGNGGASINGHKAGKEKGAGKGQAAGGRKPHAMALAARPEAGIAAKPVARAGSTGGTQQQQQQARANGAGKQMLAPLQQQQVAAGNIHRSPSNGGGGGGGGGGSLLRASTAQPATMQTSHPANTTAVSENSGTATAAATATATAVTGEAKAGSNKGRGGSVDMRVPAGSSNPLGLKV
ncbi:hypothetical protein EV178_001048 [Coemansia sp. RSA 1646]|nr:hypothetical protein EV178_001048 [Coemansia sp. RSA 1646]